MPEDQEEGITTRGLKTELIAPVVTTVGSAIAAALTTVMMPQTLANLLLVALCLMTIGVWTYTRALHRLRAKIPKLEQEILSLQSRPSPALKDTTPRFHARSR